MNIPCNANAKTFVENIQLKTIRRYDGNCEAIISSAGEVLLYFFDKSTETWRHDHLKGSLFLYKTNDDRKYSLILLNNNFSVNITSYGIAHLSEARLTLDERSLLLNVKSDLQFRFIFSNNERAQEFHMDLVCASCICRGLEIEFSKRPVQETPKTFSLTYCNERKFSLFNDDGKKVTNKGLLVE